ncbi:AMP-binding protein [Seohaeicola nanhaiensis]|uniref:AMP-binding protein n=1 Tax=Seohaeicola nanhaiensis TaxID=1387282 RepID=A0ABV9KC17_9RHOB
MANDVTPIVQSVVCPSVTDGSKTVDAAEMSRRATLIRNAIIAKGYPRGARIALSTANSADGVAAFLGLIETGLILVPINTTIPDPEKLHILADAQPVALITDQDSLPQMKDLHAPPEVLRLSDLLATDPPPAAPVETAEDEPILILFTSGSTGRPKGVKFHRGRLNGNGRLFGEALFAVGPDDVMLLPMELSSIISVTLLVAARHVGATLAIAAAPRPDALLGVLQRARVTMMMTVTTVADLLLRLTQNTPDPLPDLRTVVIGGNHVSAELSERLIAAFGARVDVIYATTECAPTTYLVNRRDVPDGAVGPAAPGVDILIIDPDGNPVPDGEPGELVVSGPQVALGYWTGEGGTSMDFGDRFATGDLGYRDALGHYHIIGRSKEVIKSGGLSVYPPEVETVLSRHPDIAGVAVVGKPHRTFGEIVVAFVVPEPGQSPSAAEIIRWSKAHLASGKCPRSVRFLQKFPETTTGKIAKTELRKLI